MNPIETDFDKVLFILTGIVFCSSPIFYFYHSRMKDRFRKNYFENPFVIWTFYKQIRIGPDSQYEHSLFMDALTNPRYQYSVSENGKLYLYYETVSSINIELLSCIEYNNASGILSMKIRLCAVSIHFILLLTFTAIFAPAWAIPVSILIAIVALQRFFRYIKNIRCF